jgi:hypothetical protein
MLTIPGHKGMQIKTTLRFHLTLVRIATIKNTTTTNVGEDAGKRNPHILLMGMYARTTTMKNNMEAF